MQIESSNFILPQNMIKGDIIPLKVSEASHWADIPALKEPGSVEEGFADMFNRALQKVNDDQVLAESLSQKMVADPASVQLHDVLLATEQARVSLTFAKTLADQAVKTYRELTNLR